MAFFAHSFDAPPAGRPVPFDPSSNKPVLPGDPAIRATYEAQSHLQQSQRHHYNEPKQQPRKPRPMTLGAALNRAPVEASLPPAAGSKSHQTHVLLSHGDAMNTRPSEERAVLSMNNEQANDIFLRRGEQQTRGSVRGPGPGHAPRPPPPHLVASPAVLARRLAPHSLAPRTSHPATNPHSPRLSGARSASY